MFWYVFSNFIFVVSLLKMEPAVLFKYFENSNVILVKKKSSLAFVILIF